MGELKEFYVWFKPQVCKSIMAPSLAEAKKMLMNIPEEEFRKEVSDNILKGNYDYDASDEEWRVATPNEKMGVFFREVDKDD